MTSLVERALAKRTEGVAKNTLSLVNYTLIPSFTINLKVRPSAVPMHNNALARALFKLDKRFSLHLILDFLFFIRTCVYTLHTDTVDTRHLFRLLLQIYPFNWDLMFSSSAELQTLCALAFSVYHFFKSMFTYNVTTLRRCWMSFILIYS